MKFLFIDFEYRNSNQRQMDLVCASVSTSTQDTDFWLYDKSGYEDLKNYLLKHKDHVHVAWNAVAEGRSYYSLGLNPRDFTWICLHAEYKMLLNHNHAIMYGEQLIDGKIKDTVPPKAKWEMTEEQFKAAQKDKPPKNLAAACFKLLGESIDTDHKNEMRDIIIYDRGIVENKKKIIEYCRSDIVFLPRLLRVIKEKYDRYGFVTVDEMFLRGRTMVNTAIMESIGYPVNREWVENFTENVPHLLRDLIEDINSQFDEPLFRENKSSPVGYSKRITEWREWIRNNTNTFKWLKTDTNNLSTALEAWTRYFSTSHTYEPGNFAHQVIRYLKFSQQLNGFVPKGKGSKNKAVFKDFMGPDDRVRAYLNPYGSQSGRYQPKATGFLPLKSAWMRSMIVPKEGSFLCGIDYVSQEFLISGLLSNDENMMEAYDSGDVYLYTAKLAGAVPKSGTRAEYPEMRNIFKMVTLGISYQMSKYGLSDALSQAMDKKITPDKAQEFIDMFYQAYSKYARYSRSIHDKYLAQRHIKLADGWVMFKDNANQRSVANCPVQGMGSCILRKAIDLAFERKQKLIFPLHDAGYFEGSIDKMYKIESWKDIMRDAFGYYFRDKELAMKLIRLDVNIWGPDLPDGDYKGMKSQSIYIDERSEKEYHRFKKYMLERPEMTRV